MRTTPDTSADTLPTLGAPIRPAAPAAAPTPVTPGIVRKPDGTLSTDLPDPPALWVAAPPASLPATEALAGLMDMRGVISDWFGW